MTAEEVMSFVQNNVPSSEELASQISDGFDRVQQMIDESNAQSIANAQESRDWQERMLRLNQEYNIAEAQKSRDWQEMMSNTALQRQMADARAAGLNPVLMASGGNGAPVTSGAVASSASAPSGAKAETNESGATAMVSLLANYLGANVNLMNQMTSALVSMANTQQVAENNERIALITGQTSRDVAGINAWSANSVAGQYVAGDILKQEMINENQYDIARMNNVVDMAQTLYQGELEKYIHKMFPSSLYQAIGSGLVAIGDIFKGLYNSAVTAAGGDPGNLLAIIEYGLKSDKTDTVLYKMLSDEANKLKSGQQKMHERQDKGDRL